MGYAVWYIKITLTERCGYLNAFLAAPTVCERVWYEVATSLKFLIRSEVLNLKHLQQNLNVITSKYFFAVAQQENTVGRSRKREFCI